VGRGGGGGGGGGVEDFPSEKGVGLYTGFSKQTLGRKCTKNPLRIGNSS